MFTSQQFRGYKPNISAIPKPPRASVEKFLKPLPSQEELDLMEAKAQLIKAKASRLSQGL